MVVLNHHLEPLLLTTTTTGTSSSSNGSGEEEEEEDMTLEELRESLGESIPVGPLVGKAATVDQVRR